MADLQFELDAVWRDLVHARRAANKAFEALAMTRLAQALVEARRGEEAALIYEESESLSPDRDTRIAQARLLMNRADQLLGFVESRRSPDGIDISFFDPDRGFARFAYLRAEQTFRELGLDEDAQQAALRCPARTPVVLNRIMPDFEVLASGFVAIKLVGPFLEAFAKKLGDQLGETTARALGRIKLRAPIPPRVEDVDHPYEESRQQLMVRLPDSSVLIEVGERLSDEAILALVDLDLVARENKGRLLRWNATDNMWQPIASTSGQTNAVDDPISNVVPEPGDGITTIDAQ